MDQIAAQAPAPVPAEPAPSGPVTLAIDVGGTKLKGALLDADGAMVGARERVSTPHPSPPGAVVPLLLAMAEKLGRFDRVSVGFPGVVRGRSVLTAPNLGTADWAGYDLAGELARRLGRPVRMLNDASVQGLGVIAGTGLECVVTLGTGFGFALYDEGRLAPHLEVGQHNCRKDMTYDQYVGNAALKREGTEKWNKRVLRALDQVLTLTSCDVLYVGGGNAKHLTAPLPAVARLVSNDAGITGGAKLWAEKLDEAFADPVSKRGGGVVMQEGIQAEA